MKQKQQVMKVNGHLQHKKPSILPFLTYAGNRDLRRELYNAYTMRGNNGNEFDNNKITGRDNQTCGQKEQNFLDIKHIQPLCLNQEWPRYLKMYLNFLITFGRKLSLLQKRRVDEMQKIIDKEGGKFKLEPSDWWYYAEKLRKRNMILMTMS